MIITYAFDEENNPFDADSIRLLLSFGMSN